MDFLDIKRKERALYKDRRSSRFSDYKYAGFWIRLLAFIIDIILVFTAIFFITPYLLELVKGTIPLLPPAPYVNTLIPSEYLIFIDPQMRGEVLWFPVLLYLYQSIIGLSYYAFFTSSSMNGTIGKWIFGIVVVNEFNEAIGIVQSVMRYWAYLFSAIPLFIGFIVIAFDKEKRGFHDRICGTRVIHKNPVTRRESGERGYKVNINNSPGQNEQGW